MQRLQRTGTTPIQSPSDSLLEHLPPAAPDEPEARARSPLWRLAGELPRISLSAALGFVAGVVFWHFVGFWSIVSQVLFHGEPLPGGPGQPVATTAASPITTGSLATPRQASVRPPAGATGGGIDYRCSALILDRASGRTRFSFCTPRMLSLPLIPGNGREDLARAVPTQRKTTTSRLQ